MRPLALLAAALGTVGIGALALAALRGEVTVYLVAFVPVLQSTSPWALLGVAALFAALFLGFWSLAPAGRTGDDELVPPSVEGPTAEGPTARFGGVILLGPIPIVFGSDRRVTTVMLVLALALAAVLLLLFLLGPLLAP